MTLAPLSSKCASLCPVCGQSNACGMNAAGGCWCTTVTVPAALIQDLLGHLPEAARTHACVCRTCIDAWHARQTAPTTR